ncbi:VOC family protein [Croceivirga thetidis]|uniref:VOC family protein n=1 Tax=Croceivirga thetidis TaxID=2721623 RepID=A0ABX1GLJ0_9FLAO|nr:VOC family protein [Croceivirga thetidis]NKI30454.1 VOC family protein [Croceivirga thetidis]
MKKTVVHFEIGCGDIDQTSDFYSKVFDWKMTRHGNAAIIDTGNDGSLGGHLNKLGPNDPENYVTVYIQTDSLESDLEAIVANGGEIFVNPVKLPDGRQFAWFKDVAGNLIGLITA